MSITLRGSPLKSRRRGMRGGGRFMPTTTLIPFHSTRVVDHPAARTDLVGAAAATPIPRTGATSLTVAITVAGTGLAADMMEVGTAVGTVVVEIAQEVGIAAEETVGAVAVEEEAAAARSLGSAPVVPP
jgi:hypothetical protein